MGLRRRGPFRTRRRSNAARNAACGVPHASSNRGSCLLRRGFDARPMHFKLFVRILSFALKRVRCWARQAPGQA
jgi:hypothetical protein